MLASCIIDGLSCRCGLAFLFENPHVTFSHLFTAAIPFFLLYSNQSEQKLEYSLLCGLQPAGFKLHLLSQISQYISARTRCHSRTITGTFGQISAGFSVRCYYRQFSFPSHLSFLSPSLWSKKQSQISVFVFVLSCGTRAAHFAVRTSPSLPPSLPQLMDRDILRVFVFLTVQFLILHN